MYIRKDWSYWTCRIISKCVSFLRDRKWTNAVILFRDFFFQIFSTNLNHFIYRDNADIERTLSWLLPFLIFTCEINVSWKYILIEYSIYFFNFILNFNHERFIIHVFLNLFKAALPLYFHFLMKANLKRLFDIIHKTSNERKQN